MSGNANKKSVVFDSDVLYRDTTEPEVLTLRNKLYGQFSRQIGLLLESKRPRKISTTKGRLNSRLAYRYPFTETIFSAYEHTPSSDTTIIMLIDGSGSMDTYVGDGVNRIQASNAICSAFAMAVDRVLGNELKFEVFLKSAPGVIADQLGTKGSFLCLSRVLTNSARNRKANDFDKILRLDTYCPFTIDGNTQGSYTAEYGVVPALMDWMSSNIETKNAIIFNLTDGETYAVVGSRDSGYMLRNQETKELRNKYMRGIPNFTMLIGRDLGEKESRAVYGDNVIVSKDNVEDMTGKLFSTLMSMLDSSLE